MFFHASVVAFFVYGFLMGLKLRARTFVVVSFALAIALSASLSALNKVFDPTDGTFAGNFLIAIVFFTAFGVASILGFAIARKIVRARYISTHPSVDEPK